MVATLAVARKKHFMVVLQHLIPDVVTKNDRVQPGHEPFLQRTHLYRQHLFNIINRMY